MGYSAKLTVKRRRGRIDAATLVRAQAGRVLPYLRQALRDGFVPEDGSARPRKGDGKPLGFDDGVLANGLYAAPVHTTRHRASIEIRVPSARRMLTEPRADGQSFIARHKILTADGRVGELINDATREYLDTVDP